tara:strand:+ start:833 stop:952 length:120 start_codon:yes stop_codon:yes gene_type:complete
LDFHEQNRGYTESIKKAEKEQICRKINEKNKIGEIDNGV